MTSRRRKVIPNPDPFWWERIQEDVRHFQDVRGDIQVDGLVGRETWDAVMDDLRALEDIVREHRQDVRHARREAREAQRYSALKTTVIAVLTALTLLLGGLAAV